MSKRTRIVMLSLLAASLPGVALAQSTIAPQAATGTAQPVRIAVIERSAKLLDRTIAVGVKRVRAQARAERQAAERRARKLRLAAFATLPGGVSQETLDTIASCESGGDPTAVSSDGTYRGLYQFDYGTWASVGGSGDPAAASPAEQSYRAALLYSRSGSSPWPVCGV